MSEYEREIDRHRRWNFLTNVGDLSFFNLAMAFLFPSTILPLYASRLTASAVLIGLVPAINDVALYLPQILMARHAETLLVKRPFVARVSIMERVPYLFVAFGIFFWPGAPDWAAYLILALSVAMARTSAGVASPGWRGMLAKVIHPERRGLLFGTGWAVGGLLGIGGAALAGRILERRDYPFNFGLLFLLAFCAQALSWTCLALNREPPKAPDRVPPRFAAYMRALPALLKARPSFSRFLVSQALIIFGGLGISFYVIYGRRAFGISDSFAAGLTMAALVSQAAVTPLLGNLSDRLGHRWMNGLAALLGAAAAAIMLLLRSPVWLYPAFVLMNLSFAGIRISQMSITMEFGGPDRAPTFSAVASTILAAPLLMAPILGGWAVDTVGFHPTFAAGLVLYAAGLLVLVFGVVDPRVIRPGRPPRSGVPPVGRGRRP